MAKIKFKLNLPGLNALMKSPEMQSILQSAADQIAASAGDGYEVETAHPISFVGIAAVWANTYDARRDNSENNTLEKAIRRVKI